jgi:DNA-binding NarL/FixJ family response regulator
MTNGRSADERIVRQASNRPLVLLSIDDDELRAKFAYELAAYGFDVAVTHVLAARHECAARRPDVIVAALKIQTGIGDLSAHNLAGDPCARGVPVVAVATDVGEATRHIAQREGCIAVCLTTCSGVALAMGLRAVLEGRNAFDRTEGSNAALSAASRA